jgi:integrase
MPRKSTTRGVQGGGSKPRQRKDGRWEARYTLGKDSGTGKQIQKSIYGKTQKEVAIKLREITSDIENGTYTEPNKMTVGVWLDIWLRDYNPDVKPRTLDGYVKQCNYRIKPQLGARKLLDLKPHEIQEFVNNQSIKQGKYMALAPKSVKNVHGILHKALGQAVLNGYIRANPATAVKLPRWVKPKINPLNDEQIKMFLNEIKGKNNKKSKPHEYQNILTFSLFTGMRISEVVGLTFDSIDFQEGTVLIDKQLQQLSNGNKDKGVPIKQRKGKYVFETPKNNKIRTINPANSIMELLRKQQELQTEWAKLAGSAWNNSEGFVFTNEVGEHMKAQTIYTSFKRIMERLELPETRLHDLRHTYAVTALQAGDDVKAVSENMGHHSVAFTLDVYGHYTPKMRKRSASLMDDFIQSMAI